MYWNFFFLQVVGTTIKFSGPATFIHNNAEAVNGGAIILISFSQIFLYHGANIDFIGNTGKYVLYFVFLATYIQYVHTTVLL